MQHSQWHAAVTTALALFVLNLLPHSSWAAVVFYVDDQAGFDAASSADVLVGTEDWSTNNLAPNQLVVVPDPLEPGVPNGPFPNGTNPSTGMTVQSNTLGGNPTAPSPGGDLAVASDGFLGTPGTQISSDQYDTSFDMIFSLENTEAVSFTPLVFDAVGSGNPGTATVRVYNGRNIFLGESVDIPVAGFKDPTTFVGIVATDGDDIGRINVVATSVNDRVAGADDIAVYVMGPVSVVDSSWGQVKALYR